MISIRAFLAIDFNDGLKSRISALQAQIRSQSISGRWKHRDNFHLTIKFLDEISEKTADEIDKVMAGLCKERESFQLYISRLGYFPGDNLLRVLWLGLSGDMKKLQRLYEDTAEALMPLGFRKEKRPFSPHITIAQDVKPVSQDAVFGKNSGASYDFTGFERIQVDRLVLFKSEQVERKRIYTPVSEYKF